MIGNKKHYLIAGASGQVGSQLLALLLTDDETGKVTSLVRSESGIDHPKLSERKVDFNALSEADLPVNCDATFICLGTTMSKAGSKDAFRRVDYEYVVKLAVFSQRKGIPQVHVISAAGASSKSFVFYNKVKGRMESEVAKLDKLKCIYFYRPSMLLGDREEYRVWETIGKKVMVALSFMIPKSSKAIQDTAVAQAMFNHAKHPQKGVHVVSNAQMLG